MKGFALGLALNKKEGEGNSELRRWLKGTNGVSMGIRMGRVKLRINITRVLRNCRNCPSRAATSAISAISENTSYINP